MLLQSLPPNHTIREAFNFVSHPDRQPRQAGSSRNSNDRESPAEILKSVSGMAEVRPVVFNRQQALARLGGLEDLLIEVLQVMQTECPVVHARIGAAMVRHEAIELKRAAHTLRGSASIVGASDLVARLLRVEQLAAASHFDAVADELPEIDRQFHALQRCLSEELLAHT